MGKQRIYYWDNAKAALILLVVMGHFLLPLENKMGGVQATYWWIYLFHMPAFVFVSGVFSKGYVEKDGKEYRLTGFITLYLIFTVLLWVLQFFFKKKINFSLLLSTSGAPWYMLAMFFWYLILPYASRLKPMYAILASIGISLLAGAYKDCGDFISISRIIVFFPFFIGGYYFDMNIVKRIKPWMRVCGGVILVFVYLILLGKRNNFLQYLDIAYGDESYASIGVSNVEGMLVRSAWYVIAVIMTISFLVVVPDKKKRWTRIGEHTLGIYIVHRLVREVLSGFGLYMFVPETTVITIPVFLLVSLLVVYFASSDWIHNHVNRAFHLDGVLRK